MLMNEYAGAVAATVTLIKSHCDPDTTAQQWSDLFDLVYTYIYQSHGCD